MIRRDFKMGRDLCTTMFVLQVENKSFYNQVIQ